ncbi:MAG: DUF1116 domain-containing protein [Bacillota bacterium]
MSTKDLLSQELKIINIGSPSFLNDYEHQNVKYTHLNWKPPAGGKLELINALKQIKPFEEKIKAANEEAVNRIKKAEAVLIDIKPAIEVIPGMTQNTILHAGPPIQWERMAGPMQGAIIGAMLYEDMAKSKEEAEWLIKAGKVIFDSAHNHSAVGPMAGIISPSMPVHILYNNVNDTKAYCTVNEGLGKVLRYGANSQEVIDRLHWIEKKYMPILSEALKLTGGIDIKSIISQALHMGDECHNRNKASTALFFREIAQYILQTSFTQQEKSEALEFIRKNEHYFLNLSMPYAKIALDAARGIKYSTVLTVMSRNGIEFGIQASYSDKWFTHQANYVKGLMFPGYSEEDAARDIGDSAITETAGIGGFAMGGAPAIVQFVGGEVESAYNYSKEMHEITVGEHNIFTLPTLDFMPTAVGIDFLKVIESGILPIINTGMAHKEAGVGQVGAGLVNPPTECFEKALLDFVKTL